MKTWKSLIEVLANETQANIILNRQSNVII